MKVVVTNVNVSCGTNRRGLSKTRRNSVKKVGHTTAIRITYPAITVYTIYPCATYRGADNFLAPPGRKQAAATEDFDFHIPYL